MGLEDVAVAVMGQVSPWGHVTVYCHIVSGQIAEE